MTLRNPLTLTHDEMQVPSSIVDGTGPRHPPKIVIHSSNRLRSEASFQAPSGSTSDDIETSTCAKSCPLLPRRCRRHARHRRDYAHYIPRWTRAMRPLGSLGPGLFQLVGYVDDLRGLRVGCVDFFGDILGDESPDLTINACQDAQYLAADGLRRHIDGDIGRPRFRDIDDQQQRLGCSCCSAQCDVSGNHKPLLIHPQVDEQIDRQRDVDDERDAVAQTTRDSGVLNLDFALTLAILPGP